MAVIYDAGDTSRIEGKAWCERHGLDPNEVRRVEDHGIYATVTFLARRDGKPYLNEQGDVATYTKRIV